MTATDREIESVLLELPEARIYGEWRTPHVAGRPDLVFLHDGLGCTKTMRDLPDRVGRALGCGAFVYDRWGYGQSDRRDSFPPFFMEDEAERLPRILEAAGIADYAMVGHSDGGTIALLHSATRPKGLRATMTIAAHIFLDHLTAGEVARHQKMIDDGEIPEFMFRFHGERGPHVLWCWTGLHRDAEYEGWDISETISAIEVPLMSVQGADDAYGTPEQISGIQAAVPHAKTGLMEGLGHFPHLDDAERMAGIAADFLRPYCG